MNYILFDDASRPHLLPFTHTRPVADIRCGILTMRERWEHCLLKAGFAHGGTTQARGLAKGPVVTGTLTEKYLQPVYPENPAKDNVYINGAIFATTELATAVFNLQTGQALVKGYQIIAARMEHAKMSPTEFNDHVLSMPAQYFEGEIHALKNVWDIFSANDKAIREDFQLLTAGRKSAKLPEGVFVSGIGAIFIEEGAHIYPGCVINTLSGPVYIAKDA